MKINLDVNKDIPKIYAMSVDGKLFDDGQECGQLHYFYLDGEAEYQNLYDICYGNIPAHSMAQSQIVFEAIYIAIDGTKKGCYVSSYYDEAFKRMKGYVWLKEDKECQPFISKAIDAYGIINTWYNITVDGRVMLNLNN